MHDDMTDGFAVSEFRLELLRQFKLCDNMNVPARVQTKPSKALIATQDIEPKTMTLVLLSPVLNTGTKIPGTCVDCGVLYRKKTAQDMEADGKDVSDFTGKEVHIYIVPKTILLDPEKPKEPPMIFPFWAVKSVADSAKANVTLKHIGCGILGRHVVIPVLENDKLIKKGTEINMS